MCIFIAWCFKCKRLCTELFKHESQANSLQWMDFIKFEMSHLWQNGRSCAYALILAAQLLLIHYLFSIHQKIHHSPYASWPWLNIKDCPQPPSQTNVDWLYKTCQKSSTKVAKSLNTCLMKSSKFNLGKPSLTKKKLVLILLFLLLTIHNICVLLWCWVPFNMGCLVALGGP